MKFNALVVAAMVIASVNASGADEPPSGAEYSGGRSNTELIQGSSGNGPGKSRESGVTEYDPKCDPIIIKLNKIWIKVDVLEPGLRSQMPAYYKLMKGRT
ncbi:hypothetical protein BASA61_005091 [Batrachochytrium salamandrivorans]|nr:hypothetical protein BASA60_000366 [Batrachochytrium salamandrivorans]KAH6570528.1 hypothetical protein BASA62_004317 [Batrachochytrium salamandrivorans]KAH6590844.1 hypothetical protein BASA61_005091 [Batrachochytrium salamandrivorans]